MARLFPAPNLATAPQVNAHPKPCKSKLKTPESVAAEKVTAGRWTTMKRLRLSRSLKKKKQKETQG